MTTNHDHTSSSFDTESQVTAYVLGELDETATAAFEERLESDAALRRDVDAIRSTTASLEAALGQESGPTLTADQREAILEGPRPVIFTFRRVATGIGLAAAACVVITAALPTLAKARRENVAISQAPVEATMEEPLKEGNDRRSLLNRDKGAGAGGGQSASSVDALESAQVAGDLRGDTAGSREQLAARAPVEERSAGRRKMQTAPPATTAVPAKRTPPGARPSTAPPPAPARKMSRRGGREETRINRTLEDAPTSAGRSAGAAGGEPGALVDGERFRATREAEAPSLESAGEVDRDSVLQDLLDDDEFQRDRQRDGANREAYGHLVDNAFERPTDSPLSTFSIDVDTASYANARRFLTGGVLPPKDAVRIEELINYFDYAYEPPSGEQPFSVNAETTACPWQPEHRLVRVGLKGRVIEQDMRPATNLVFLLDVSGSMNDRNKLPLVKQAMTMLTKNLIADDRVAIVVYAGASGLVLDSTYGDEREKIVAALDRLHAGGSTNGGAGIELAYSVAQDHFIDGGVNRVILCTDGDFNVGVSSEGDLVRLIEEKRKSGVFLTVLGFGQGNLQDARMEKLSNAGNGNFGYIDTIQEARKLLVEDMSGTLVTIAKDVKIQVEFNPAQVGAYRLIGYANRMLAARDFNDDTKDAGEIGAGHTVTALYEIAPLGAAVAAAEVDELKYQGRRAADPPAEQEASNELLTVKLRYKEPDGSVSKLIERPVIDDDSTLATASADVRFAAAVASFGMVLRESVHRGQSTYASVLDLATPATGDDTYRMEFLRLVEVAQSIASTPRN